jgi:hypothetical protein
LKKGDKSLVGNKGYRRFLATSGGGHFAIDRAKVEDDAKLDGIFVLLTNAGLSPLEAMLCYKQFGWWSGRFARQRACSPRARSLISSTIPFAATCCAAFSRSC